jgi:hypothetical protein
MFNSTVLDVLAGVVFTFLAVSLVASAATEAVASALKWRSATLLQGIKTLLNDPKFTGLAQAIYQHALVSPRSDGTAVSERALERAPSYIEPSSFADALIEITQIVQTAPDDLKHAIDDRIDSPQIRQLLHGMVDRTAGDLDAMRREIAGWFDNAMDRLSGAYKRRTQVWCFLIALALAGILNVSTLHVARVLWHQPDIARSITADPAISPLQALQTLEELPLPIGWTTVDLGTQGAVDWAARLLGWIITAVATLFGAPFWFDVLQRVARLKGSGPSPAERARGAAAAS